MRKSTGFTAIGLVACLTICQFAKADEFDFPESSSSVSRPRNRVRASKRVKSNRPAIDKEMAAIEPENYNATQEMRADLDREGWMRGTAQTPLYPLPARMKFIADFELGGEYSTLRESPLALGVASERSVESSGYDAKLRAAFGLTRNLYVGTTFGFGARSLSEASTTLHFTGNSTTKTTVQGFSEPGVMLGAQALWGFTRFAFEFEGRIPVGPMETTGQGTSFERNYLQGGASYIPRLIVVSDQTSIRLFGIAQYTVLDERETQEVTTSGAIQDYALTGGNQLRLTAGFEIPQAWNLGFFADFLQSDLVERRAMSTAYAAPVDSSAAAQGGVGIYAGIPLLDDALIVPKIVYLTTLERQTDTSTINEANTVTFGIGTKFMF